MVENFKKLKTNKHKYFPDSEVFYIEGNWKLEHSDNLDVSLDLILKKSKYRSLKKHCIVKNLKIVIFDLKIN
jgi:hypothetical protein